MVLLCYIAASLLRVLLSFFFFFNDTATTEIYTLSLHDALPISVPGLDLGPSRVLFRTKQSERALRKAPFLLKVSADFSTDRKSTRLNSSHLGISYAVFCLKKKNDTVTKTLRLLIRTH